MSRKRMREFGKERLQRILARIGKARVQVATDLGVTDNALRKWEEHGRVPEDMVAKVLALESSINKQIVLELGEEIPAKVVKKLTMVPTGVPNVFRAIDLRAVPIEDLIKEFARRGFRVEITPKAKKPKKS